LKIKRNHTPLTLWRDFIYIGFQLRVQGRGAYGVRRALAALVFTQRKAARADTAGKLAYTSAAFG
jgi:hypothetical protein